MEPSVSYEDKVDRKATNYFGIICVSIFNYCKTGNVGQQLSLTKLTMPVESLNFVLGNQCSPQAVLE